MALDYTGLINATGTIHGVPPALLQSLVQVESSGNPLARSSAGAIGLTQLMPATALSLGVKDPYNAAQNLNGGAAYLAQLKQRYGDWRSALSAYNSGSPTTAAGLSYADKVLAGAGLSSSDVGGALQAGADALQNAGNSPVGQALGAVSALGTATSQSAAGAALNDGAKLPVGSALGTVPFIGSSLATISDAIKASVPSAVLFLVGLLLAIFGFREMLA